MIRQTHTFVELDISPAAYDEIRAKLEAAGYEHAFIGSVIDMHGIGLVKIEPEAVGSGEAPAEGPR